MSIQSKMRRLYRRKAMLGVPMEVLRHVPHSFHIRHHIKQFSEDNDQMCNVDRREKCAICKEVFISGDIKFLIKRQPCHEDCFRNYMKKMEIEI